MFKNLKEIIKSRVKKNTAESSISQTFKISVFVCTVLEFIFERKKKMLWNAITLLFKNSWLKSCSHRSELNLIFAYINRSVEQLPQILSPLL